MKNIFFIIIIFAIKLTFGQADLPLPSIQNFYTVCKANDFSTYMRISKGVEILQTNQYSRALRIFNKVLKNDTTLCDVWYLKGYCLQNTGKLNKSIVCCDKSLELNSNNSSAWTIKGYSNFFLKDTITALSDFDNAIELSPEKIDGYYGKAMILYQKNELNNALEIINKFYINADKTNVWTDTKKIKKLKKIIERKINE